MNYTGPRELTIAELSERGWGRLSIDNASKYGWRADYHKRKARDSGFLMKTYHNMAAMANGLLDELTLTME